MVKLLFSNQIDKIKMNFVNAAESLFLRNVFFFFISQPPLEIAGEWKENIIITKISTRSRSRPVQLVRSEKQRVFSQMYVIARPSLYIL